MLLTFVLGLAACAAAIYFQNWHILVIAFPILLLMEGILDFRYRKLELTDKP